ncbi:DUF5677 domain-containing protein [Magnetovibrio blakemorei]|uniref:Uncharacterized protein n=1 Tax=Magnetovibrio blakemorei TaxID=28181 RepID=A0A1E5QBI9_9PROT|nr:DUF5677 domain-containing protein [Magnetovibrio blakemorei]OEJ69397.1 hypothetical protein BEN30_03025 [Magnetovibrio blakemorei]
MEDELKKHIRKAVEIKTSGRWAELDQKICQLADNHNGHETWQIKVLRSLCFRNFSEYLALKKAYEDFGSEPSLLAWRARNLLEISVWSLYCARNRENTRIFFEDSGRDIIGIPNEFIKWGKITSKDDDWLKHIESVKQDISTRFASEGIESLDGSYKQVRSAASECGFEDGFNVFYKLFSKFAHPTAMLIMADTELEKEKLQKNMFFSHGCMFFVGAFTELEKALSVLDEHPA